VTEPVTSPTFNIMLVHEGRLRLYHVDLYRLDRSDQLEDIDLFGTIEAGGVTAVEWGDRFPEVLESGTLRIVIHIRSDEERALEVGAGNERGEALLTEWARSVSALDGVTVDVGDAT
jgi:tRNA threonylcarbamoyladenosine biosynthesis protein TsaE